MARILGILTSLLEEAKNILGDLSKKPLSSSIEEK